jgi:hypothetical protein
MLFGAVLLAVLDGTILSATPNLTREVFALAVTIVVGGFILAVWRSNSKLEKAAAAAAASPEKGARGKSKPVAGNSSAK